MASAIREGVGRVVGYGGEFGHGNAAFGDEVFDRVFQPRVLAGLKVMQVRGGADYNGPDGVLKENKDCGARDRENYAGQDVEAGVVVLDKEYDADEEGAEYE